MSRLPLLAAATLDPAQAALRAEILARRGRGPQRFALVDENGALTGPFNALLYAPEVGRAVARLGEAVRFETTLTDREREMITLAVAAHVSSEYEWYAHAPLGRAAGLADADLDALRAGHEPEFVTATEAALHALAAAVLRGDVTDECFDAAVAAGGHQKVVEVVVLVGYYRLLSDVLETFRTGPPAEPSR